VPTPSRLCTEALPARMADTLCSPSRKSFFSLSVSLGNTRGSKGANEGLCRRSVKMLCAASATDVCSASPERERAWMMVTTRMPHRPSCGAAVVNAARTSRRFHSSCMHHVRGILPGLRVGSSAGLSCGRQAPHIMVFGILYKVASSIFETTKSGAPTLRPC
jgi:hypothetical protein